MNSISFLFFLGLLGFSPFALAQFICTAGTLVTNPVGTVPPFVGDSNYNDFQVCSWTISPSGSPPKSITIQWLRMDLEYGFDWVAFSHLQDPNNILYNFTGYLLPDTIEIPTPNGGLYVQFRSDELISFTGFQFTYTSNYCNASCNNGHCLSTSCVCNAGWTGQFCNIPYCPNNCFPNGVCNNVTMQCVCNPGFFGGDCTKVSSTYCSGVVSLTDTYGQFIDHLPNSNVSANTYLPNTNCMWTINPGKTNVPLTIALDRHQITEPTHYIYVYEPDLNGNLLAIWSTDGFPVEPLVVPTGVATLQFVSDAVGPFMSGFTASYTSFATCPNQCSNNGFCIAGLCYCQGGFTGADCAQIAPITPLVPNVVIADFVSEYNWKFYYITVPANAAVLSIKFAKTLYPNPPKQRWGGGHPVFYLRYQYYPTLLDFNELGQYFDTLEETGVLTVNNPLAGRWGIGVFGLEASSYTLELQPIIVNPTYDNENGGLIAGIVILVIGVVSIAVLVAFLVYRRRKMGGRVFREMNDEATPTPQ